MFARQYARVPWPTHKLAKETPGRTEKINTTETTKPGAFDTDTSNKKVSVVNGTTSEGRVGPGVILKVMAGDKFKARSQAWYQPTGMDNTTDNTLQDIVLNLLTQATQGVVAAGKGSIGEQVTSSNLNGGMQQLLTSQTPQTGAPKAYLNWILFDEKKFSKVASGFVAIPSITGATQKQLLQINGGNDVQISQNGYLYVYVSNVSKGNVYFDDVRIEHTRGPLREETHYYPFGLTMAGISSKAAGGVQNRYKFNGGNELQSGEFSDGSGLEWYDAVNRMYDPQLGRFFQIDEFGEVNEDVSLYNFGHNNPIAFNDPLGLLDGRPGEKPAELGEVVVKSYSVQQRNQLYWQMRNANIDIERVSNIPLKQWLRHWDKSERFMERVHQMTREQDMIVLEAASYFIPIPGIAWASKAFKLKKLVQSFRLKRGIVVAEEATEAVAKEIIEDGAEAAANTGIQLSKKKFGHTFTTHGEDMTNFLIKRAEGSGMPQGQFLDNQKAAQFILDNLGKTANGAANVALPTGFPARVIMSDGTFKAATHIRIIPGGGGVKTSYPLIP